MAGTRDVCTSTMTCAVRKQSGEATAEEHSTDPPHRPTAQPHSTCPQQRTHLGTVQTYSTNPQHVPTAQPSSSEPTWVSRVTSV